MGKTDILVILKLRTSLYQRHKNSVKTQTTKWYLPHISPIHVSRMYKTLLMTEKKRKTHLKEHYLLKEKIQLMIKHMKLLKIQPLRTKEFL